MKNTFDLKGYAQEQGVRILRGGQLDVQPCNITQLVSGDYESRGGTTTISGEVELENTGVVIDGTRGKIITISVEYGGNKEVEAVYPNRKPSKFLIEATGSIAVDINLKEKTASVEGNRLETHITSPYNRMVKIAEEKDDLLTLPIIYFDDEQIELI